MKTLITITVLLISIFSCADITKSNTTSNDNENPQKWKLVKISGSFANVPATTGSDMLWQEYYLLKNDNTFIKSREINKKNTEAKGTYAYKTLTDGEYLELTYESDNTLIENCTADTKELLRRNNENELAGTSIACDGPGLFYEKIK